MSLLASGCGAEAPQQTLTRAKTAIAKSAYADAEIHLKNVIRRTGGSAESRRLLAQVYSMRFDPAAAAQEWERAIEAGDDVDVALPALVEAQVRSAQVRQALESAQARRSQLTGAPARAATEYWVGQALLALGRRDDARTSFELAAALDPSNPLAGLALVAMRSDTQTPHDALEAVDRVLKSHPNLAEAHALEARLQLRGGDLAAARESLRSSLHANPRETSVRVLAIELSLRAGDLPAAKSDFAVLQGQQPNSLATVFLRARIASLDGSLEAARDDVLAVLKAAPDLMPAVALAGQLTLRLGLLEQAAGYANKLHSANPTSPAAAALLAQVRLASNAPSRALEVLQPILDAGPDSVELHQLAGEAYLRLADYGRAVEQFDLASRAGPESAKVLTQLGMARMLVGDATAGLNDIDRAARMPGSPRSADYVLVSGLLRVGHVEEASAAADRLLVKQNDDPVAHLLKARTAVAAERSQLARTHLEKALELQPQFIPAFAAIVSLELADGRAANARARLDSLRREGRTTVGHFVAMADAARRANGSLGDPREYLEAAVADHPASIEATLTLADEHARARAWDKALSVLEKGLSRAPNDVRLLEAQAGILVAAGRPGDALRALDRALRLKPDAPGLLLRAATLRKNAGDLAGAEEALRRLHAQRPNDLRIVRMLANLLAESGRIALARELAESLRTREGGLAPGWELQGDLSLAASEPSRAVDEYMRAWDAAESPILVAKAYAATRRAKGEAEAERWVRAKLAANPGAPSLHAFLGDQAVRRNDWEAALTHYEAVLSSRTNDVVALNNLAWAQFKLDKPQALQTAERAAKLAPRNPAVANTLGSILVARGRVDEGLAQFRHAAELAPRNPEMRFAQARALADAKRVDEARGAFSGIERDFAGTAVANEARKARERLPER